MNLLEDIPAEIWLAAFGFLYYPADLASVILTCRQFYDCGIGSLLTLRDCQPVGPKPVWTVSSLQFKTRVSSVQVSPIPAHTFIAQAPAGTVRLKYPGIETSSSLRCLHFDFCDPVQSLIEWYRRFYAGRISYYV